MNCELFIFLQEKKSVLKLFLWHLIVCSASFGLGRRKFLKKINGRRNIRNGNVEYYGGIADISTAAATFPLNQVPPPDPWLGVGRGVRKAAEGGTRRHLRAIIWCFINATVFWRFLSAI